MKSLICANLWLILLAVLNPLYAQNFVTIGSDEAPIRYIKGTGSNIGIFLGVDIPHEAGKQQGHIRRGRAHGGGSPQAYCPPPPLQCVKPAAGRHRLDFTKRGRILWPERTLIPEFPITPLDKDDRTLHIVDLTQGYIPEYNYINAHNEYDPNFQILPVYEYDIEEEEFVELFLPSFCLDQELAVPDTSPTTEFTIEAPAEVADNVLVGVYRFDRYLDENVKDLIFSNGTSLAFTPGTLTDAEILMALFSVVEIDSTSLGVPGDGFYNLKHMHLDPSAAQWVLWTALEDQDEASFLVAFNKIRELFSDLPPATEQEIAIFYFLNHVVFNFAEMGDFQGRFTAPGPIDNLEPKNLDPIAQIKTYPSLHEEQNTSAGIELHAHESFDPDGGIESYEWAIEHHTFSGPELNAPFLFPSTTETPIILTVTDNAGGVSTDTVYVPYSTLIVSSTEEEKNIKQGIQDLQIFPNPVLNKATITFYAKHTENLNISVYDISGKRIKELSNKTYLAGTHRLTWDTLNDSGRASAPGVYFVKIHTPSELAIQKMVLVH